MKNEYYIGEFASLLNISDQTLRYYDKIGLMKPAKTNHETNYRMYTLNQIWTLERIRYLQTLGLNLDEIKVATDMDNISGFVAMMEMKRAELEAEISRLVSTKECIEEYLQYYHYIKENSFPDMPFKSSYDARYIMVEPYRTGEQLIGTAGPRLLIKKARNEFSQVKFLRQIGFLLDYENLLQGNIKPTHYFIFIKGKPAIKHKDILEVPAGKYVCFRGNIISADYHTPVVNKLFENDGKNRLALAIEYESNLDTSNEAFLQSLFEVQIFI